MEKTRVPKGEKYWCISTTSFFDSAIIMWRCDMREVRDDKYFCGGNYFHTEEEAEQMARKLRAVLKGAEVYTLDEITEIRANAFADGMEAERRKSKIVK